MAASAPGTAPGVAPADIALAVAEYNLRAGDAFLSQGATLRVGYQF